MDEILFHINHGMLSFVGFEVLPPFIAWSPAHITQEARKEILAQYEKRLLHWEKTAPIPFHPLTDYDENFQLKPEKK
jgi:NAD(P)H dehydrogenase (quinone)